MSPSPIRARGLRKTFRSGFWMRRTERTVTIPSTNQAKTPAAGTPGRVAMMVTAINVEV